MRFTYRKKIFFTFAVIASLCLSSCKKDEINPDKGFSVDFFYEDMHTLTLDVAYEEGAEPYTTTVTGVKTWSFTESNIEKLFSHRPQPLDVVVPLELSEMLFIRDQNKTSYKTNDILSLADDFRRISFTAEEGNFFVIFLNGYYHDGDSVRQNILGVHISETTVVALFKPVIESSGASATVRQFVEQSVLIHEIGHGIGLVNRGVPMVNAHHDSAHPAHCTNTQCVMYWQNEITFTLGNFVQQFRDGVETFIFGPECQSDVSNYQP